jgi:hypothetical protein
MVQSRQNGCLGIDPLMLLPSVRCGDLYRNVRATCQVHRTKDLSSRSPAQAFPQLVLSGHQGVPAGVRFLNRQGARRRSGAHAARTAGRCPERTSHGVQASSWNPQAQRQTGGSSMPQASLGAKV